MAVTTGESWNDTRKLISEKYQLETVISSHDVDKPNFSENTNLSEVMFIARKRASGESKSPTKYVNLWRNPRSIHEALEIAEKIKTFGTVGIEDSDISSIECNNGKIGEVINLEVSKGGNWTGALFAQTELLRIFWLLQNGRLRLSDQKSEKTLPLCHLSLWVL
jgi:hypothetical protein